MFKTILAVVAVTIVVLIVMAVVDRVSGDISPGESNSSTAAKNDSLQVTISGEISHSGTYFLPLASTLGDLILSAGGGNSNADSRCYNTTLSLIAKASYYIAPLYDNGDTCAVTPISKVNVNTADAETLKKGVESFSTTVCSAIVSYRASNGDFAQLEDLKNVAGIGPSTFEKCKNLVTLHE